MTNPTFRRDNGTHPGSSAPEVVIDIVDSSPDYSAGELESMQARLTTLTQLVGALVGAMPAAQQVEFVGTNCYGWEAE